MAELKTFQKAEMLEEPAGQASPNTSSGDRVCPGGCPCRALSAELSARAVICMSLIRRAKYSVYQGKRHRQCLPRVTLSGGATGLFQRAHLQGRQRGAGWTERSISHSQALSMAGVGGAAKATQRLLCIISYARLFLTRLVRQTMTIAEPGRWSQKPTDQGPSPSSSYACLLFIHLLFTLLFSPKGTQSS